MAAKQLTSAKGEKASTSNGQGETLMRLQQFQQAALNLRQQGLDVSVSSYPGEFTIAITVKGIGWCRICKNLLPFELMHEQGKCQQCAEQKPA